MSQNKRTLLSVIGIVLSALGAVCGVLANTGCAGGKATGPAAFNSDAAESSNAPHAER